MTGHPSGEVPERAKRRTFTAAYKLKIVDEYDSAGPGLRGEVLRREGLYSSHLTQWRKARDIGALAALAAARGRPPVDPVERDNQRLRDLNVRLEEQLDTAQRVIEVQGKSRLSWKICPGERTRRPWTHRQPRGVAAGRAHLRGRAGERGCGP